MKAHGNGVANGYLWRALTPAQIQSIRAQRARGARPKALAEAYGVSPRTIYRALHRDTDFVVVHIGSWFAEFELSEDGPIRCTAWMAA